MMSEPAQLIASLAQLAASVSSSLLYGTVPTAPDFTHVSTLRIPLPALKQLVKAVYIRSETALLPVPAEEMTDLYLLRELHQLVYPVVQTDSKSDLKTSIDDALSDLLLRNRRHIHLAWNALVDTGVPEITTVRLALLQQHTSLSKDSAGVVLGYLENPIPLKEQVLIHPDKIRYAMEHTVESCDNVLYGLHAPHARMLQELRKECFYECLPVALDFFGADAKALASLVLEEEIEVTHELFMKATWVKLQHQRYLQSQNNWDNASDYFPPEAALELFRTW